MLISHIIHSGYQQVTTLSVRILLTAYFKKKTFQFEINLRTYFHSVLELRLTFIQSPGNHSCRCKHPNALLLPLLGSTAQSALNTPSGEHFE